MIMLSSRRADRACQAGIGLVEIMVAMAIGMVTALVIMQIVTNFEGQKRATTGTADAQTNGAIALYQIQQQAQMAGFGLPTFSTDAQPLNCNPLPQVDHDGDAGAVTPNIDVFPVLIQDGGGGNSDTIMIRSSTTPRAGAAVKIQNVVANTNTVQVVNNFGCEAGDIAMAISGSSCVTSTVTALPSNTEIVLQSVNGMDTNNIFSCIGRWTESRFFVQQNNLMNWNRASVAGIVNLQAQYGLSADNISTQVTSWVNATGMWANMASIPVPDRRRIRAIRVAVVARNPVLEKESVTLPCTNSGEGAKGPCAWVGAADSPAPTIDLMSADPEWRRYRYRVFETIIPLRSMIWLAQ